MIIRRRVHALLGKIIPKRVGVLGETGPLGAHTLLLPPPREGSRLLRNV